MADTLSELERERAEHGLNGRLRKSWEVHCVRCERAALGVGYGGSTNDAAAELRSYGWGTREGYWACPDCAATLGRRRSLPPGEAVG